MLRVWMELMMCLLSRFIFEAFAYGLGAWLVASGHVDICNFKGTWLASNIFRYHLPNRLQQISQCQAISALLKIH